MKKNIVFFVFFIFYSFFSGQNNLAIPFPKIASDINFPIKIPLEELNNIINSQTQNLLYEDNSYTDNNNDQFKIKVWKTRPIRLVAGTAQNFLIEVPLKIWAEKGIGTLGVYHYQATEFEAVMYFNSTLNFNKNWSITTQTKSNGYKWVQKPVMDFGAVKIPITPLVEKSLKTEQDKFCATIDQQMAVQLNFQKTLLEAWNNFRQPFLINSDYDTWLKISPQKISVSPLKFYKNEIQTLVGINLISETFVGSKPADNPLLKAVADFEQKEIQNQKFKLITTAIIPMAKANEIAVKQFLNKEFDFRNENSKVKIAAINVREENENIVIEADLEQAIQGKVFISGVPTYDAETKKIVLRGTQFKLKTKNFFQKSMSVLFKRTIINKIEEEYGIPTGDMEKSAKEKVEETFNKNYGNGINLNGKVFSLAPEKILLQDNNIITLISTEALLNLSYRLGK
jgi:hypothetical protein